MMYDDAKNMANNIARKFAGAIFCGAALVVTSLYGQIPDYWIWLACALAAGATYFAVGAAVTHYYVVAFTQDAVELAPESVPLPGMTITTGAATPTLISAVGAPPDRHPADTIRAYAPEWVGDVDWAKLHALIRQPNAPLSRAALDGIVDQRFYSPREGDDTMPFPELMVEIGAAIRITNGGGQPSYAWSPSASRVIARVWQAFNASPTPQTA